MDLSARNSLNLGGKSIKNDTYRPFYAKTNIDTSEFRGIS